MKNQERKVIEVNVEPVDESQAILPSDRKVVIVDQTAVVKTQQNQLNERRIVLIGQTSEQAETVSPVKANEVIGSIVQEKSLIDGVELEDEDVLDLFVDEADQIAYL